MPTVRFLAHRARRGGASTDVLGENTIAAVRSALALGPSYIEVDTRNLSDGTIVLRHDPSVVFVEGQTATVLAEITRDAFAERNSDLFSALSFEALLDVIAQSSPHTTFVLDVKDLDERKPAANLSAYLDPLVERGLERRIVIISWNIRVVTGVSEWNRNRPDDRRIRVGLSFVPFPLPSVTFRSFERLVNRLIRASFGGVTFYNVGQAREAALGRASTFPICFDTIQNVRRSLGDDAILCFHKMFAQSWARRIVKLGNDPSSLPRAVWLYDYDDIAEIRALSSEAMAALATEEVVLFSRILDRFDFNAEERRLSGTTAAGWTPAQTR